MTSVHVIESLIENGRYIDDAPIVRYVVKLITKWGIIIGGTYRHYKGGIYKVTGVGRHSEDKDKLMVSYVDMNDVKSEWYRPLEMFLGKVEGLNCLRFRFIAVE